MSNRVVAPNAMIKLRDVHDVDNGKNTNHMLALCEGDKSSISCCEHCDATLWLMDVCTKFPASVVNFDTPLSKAAEWCNAERY